jgi:AhpD family alkylhydroperoxidase
MAVFLFASSGLAERSVEARAALADVEKTNGFVPGFLKAMPDAALPGTWEEMKGLQMNPNTAIPPKYKELIGLAVSSQIPCKYCIIGHTEFAKASGANADELGLAVAEAGLTRHWSTFLNGMQMDEGKLRKEVAATIERMKKMDPNAPPPTHADVVDAQSAYKDIEVTIGSVPSFLKLFPQSAVAGAWKAMRDVEMNPKGAIPGKYMSLIGLAVASQIPCQYCIVTHTEFAKAEGATDAEIAEAVAMAANTRNLSTLLNGLQVDEVAFKKDLQRLLKAPKGKIAER